MCDPCFIMMSGTSLRQYRVRDEDRPGVTRTRMCADTRPNDVAHNLSNIRHCRDAGARRSRDFRRHAMAYADTL